MLRYQSTASTQDGDPNIAKGTAMAVLFVLSFLIGTIPMKLSKIFEWNNPKNNKFVKLLLAFGGGVLICTTFIHLLPEVSENFEELNIESRLEIHYPELLMCIGFFAMYFVEECVHVYLHKKEMQKENENIKILRRSLSIRKAHIHRNTLGSVKETGDDVVNSNHISNKLSEDTNYEKKHHHEHHKKVDHSHVVIDQESIDSTVKAIRGLLIVLALSIHELFEGLAVGLEKSTSAVWYMFGAVSAHKLVLAFCIGVELVTSGMKTKLIVIYVLTFAVVSPLGIGTGLIVSNVDKTSTTLVSVILQGLASGTLLYVVFFEILQEENKSGLKQYFAILCGFLLMFVISLFS